jgi:hypothetical protein
MGGSSICVRAICDLPGPLLDTTLYPEADETRTALENGARIPCDMDLADIPDGAEA